MYRALTMGPMRPMAEGLSDAELKQIVSYLSNGSFNASASAHPQKVCKVQKNWFDYGRPPLASGWGITDTQNSRLIPQDVAKLRPDTVPRLKLKWAFAFPDATSVRSQPAVAGGAIFIGDQNGTLYALDAASGCVRWRYETGHEIHSAITISKWDPSSKPASEPVLYFATTDATAYAVGAISGKPIWETRVDDGPKSRTIGAPTLVEQPTGSRLYVPVSSMDANDNPDVACCAFRGSVSALDGKTGKVIWKSYAITTEPKERWKNSRGVAQIGPSGAGIFNSPTFDPKRNLIYVGTGENHTGPAENGGAVLAIDAQDGTIKWVYQNYTNELYNWGCARPDREGCPKEFKGRFGLDVAASPILVTGDDGKQILVVGQKTGDVFGLAPDDEGRLLWRRRITRADYNLGVVFGMAVDGRTVVATVMDHDKNPRDGAYWGVEELGLYAMDAFTGEPRWSALSARDCIASTPCRGYSAALTAAPGMIFAGAKDGWVRVFSSDTGTLIWQTNTAQAFRAVNGDIAQGGDIDKSSPIVIDGMMIVESGYGSGNAAVNAGNALLVYTIDGK
jgi:polyvinyl alcohol dehydrogenase (cytochrome)